MPRPLRIAAVVPAAGLSRRMGAFKPAMILGGRTVIERVLGLYADAGVGDVRVVVGHHGQALRKILEPLAVAVIDHPHYRQGMFTSVQRGVASIGDAVDAFFMHPADIPLVRAHTLGRLIEAFAASPAMVTCPVFDDRPGHPPLIRRDAAAAILTHDGRGGLRRVLKRFAAQTQHIAVADRGILLDLDTPEDACALAERLDHANCLDEEECRVLMTTLLRTPDATIAHSRCVARAAVAIAEAVDRSGCPQDIALVRSAALLHDAAKGRPDHAAAGAALLARMGFADLAAVVAVHTDVAVTDDQPLDACQIVYLADKLAAGDALVDPERRFADKLARYGHDPAAAEAIVRRRDAARRIRDKIERATGRTLGDLLEAAGPTAEGAPCKPC